MIPSSLTLYAKEHTNASSTSSAETQRPSNEEKQRFEELLGKRQKERSESKKSTNENRDKEEANINPLSYAFHSPIYSTQNKQPQQIESTTATPQVTVNAMPQSDISAPRPIAPDTLETLSLRVTQGPWAGLLISATLKNGTLNLRLSGKQTAHLKKIEAQNNALSALFGDSLDQPFTLELHHAD